MSPLTFTTLSAALQDKRLAAAAAASDLWFIKHRHGVKGKAVQPLLLTRVLTTTTYHLLLTRQSCAALTTYCLLLATYYLLGKAVQPMRSPVLLSWLERGGHRGSNDFAIQREVSPPALWKGTTYY